MHGGIPLSDAKNEADSPAGIANSLDILSPSDLSWGYASNGPARKYHSLCYIKSIDSIVLFGGSDQNIASYNDVKSYSMKSSSWSYSLDVEGDKPSERVLHSAVCIDDSMLVFGGTHTIGDSPSDSTVWMLKANNESSFTWSMAPIPSSSLGMSPSARFGHSAALYNNNMYIYGGIGPSGKDDTVYMLDINKWEWSQINPSNADSKDSDNGVKTRVLIAAIVSSVLGIICVGIAAFVFYRWNRRRSTVQEKNEGPAADSEMPGSSEYSSSGNAIANAETVNGKIGTDGYVDDNDNQNIITPINATGRRGIDTGPNTEPHKEFETHRHSDINPQIRSNILAQYNATTDSRSSAYTPVEVINDILLSGKPLPAWLREAVKRSDKEQNTPEANPIMTHKSPTLSLDVDAESRKQANVENHGSSKPTSAANSNARQKSSNGTNIHELKDNTDNMQEVSSVHSAETNDAQSAQTYEPIKYVTVSRASTDAGSMMQGTTKEDRQGSDTKYRGTSAVQTRNYNPELSDADFDSAGLQGDIAARNVLSALSSSIAQPMSPPVPLRMNSLYGELGNRGITIGEASIPQASVATSHMSSEEGISQASAGSRPTQAPREDISGSSTSRYTMGPPQLSMDSEILSPLDRLARYHALDSWMVAGANAGRTESLSQWSDSNETDDTSKIYAAHPVRRSSDSF
ncbi:hypothetical protein IW140_004923 [Coemansia sp. RSA 1813]|nr:hypothetical protein EV178_005216 [Coemansia sp. RSA 1646]KAJ2566454.1 hypothetical protein IW140_004923 [Coemansia sp. RSA 1813]